MLNSSQNKIKQKLKKNTSKQLLSKGKKSKKNSKGQISKKNSKGKKQTNKSLKGGVPQPEPPKLMSQEDALNIFGDVAYAKDTDGNLITDEKGSFIYKEPNDLVDAIVGKNGKESLLITRLSLYEDDEFKKLTIRKLCLEFLSIIDGVKPETLEEKENIEALSVFFNKLLSSTIV